MANPRTKRPGSTTAVASAGVRPVDGGPTSTGYLQPVIPQLRGITDGEPASTRLTFAHPFEKVFADILSFYGEPWTYEPTPFVLAEGPDGMASELFMPDFYLPRQRLYIELTAMRQRLVTRKHRKLRHLAERYPNVRVKLLYRRDYERLATVYGTERTESPSTGSILVGEDAIRERVAELARAIAADHADRGDASPLLCLAIGASSEAFAGLLGEALRQEGTAFATERVDVARFRPEVEGEKVRFLRKPVEQATGRRVLVVADIVSTGLTLNFVAKWLYRNRAVSVDVCALLDRAEARIVQVPLRYVGFAAPNELLVGFGLNLFQEYQMLPHIRSLAPSGDGAS